MLLVAALSFTLAMAACSHSGGGTSSAPETPAYYVFERIEFDGYTITDPNQLILDGDGGYFEKWYYLSLALLDGENGKLCTFGRIVNFTYDLEGSTITLHAPTNQGIDFGYDGEKLELGEGTISMQDGSGISVLRQVDEPPVAALAPSPRKLPKSSTSQVRRSHAALPCDVPLAVMLVKEGIAEGEGLP